MDQGNSTGTPVNQTPTPPNQNLTPGSQPSLGPTPPVGSNFSPSQPSVPQKDFTPPKPMKTGKKGLKILLIVLVLALAAGAAWWFFIKKDKSTTTTTPQPTTTTSTVTTPTFAPVNIAYAFKAKDADPFITYTRLATGGDRVQGKTLIKDEPIISSDVNGSNVAFVTSKSIYVSTDAGKNYTAIYELATGEQITSIKFSSDGKTIVYGSLPKAGGKNQVKTTDLTGKNGKNLFTSTKEGVYVLAYNTVKNKIVYQEGCFNCDTGRDLPILRDLSSNKTTNLLTAAKGEVLNVAVSNDFTALIYVESSDTNSSSGIVSATTLPIKINTVSLDKDNKSIQITTIGKKGEKNTDGTPKFYQTTIGFVAGTNTPYYSADKQLFTIKSGKPSLTFKSSSIISMVPYVGANEVIVGVVKNQDAGEYTLLNYNISSAKSTQIFVGDNNTVIFGVTTK